MSIVEPHELPNGQQFSDRSTLLAPDGSHWDVSSVEHLPHDDPKLTVWLSGPGDGARQITLDTMEGWTVFEFDRIEE